MATPIEGLHHVYAHFPALEQLVQRVYDLEDALSNIGAIPAAAPAASTVEQVSEAASEPDPRAVEALERVSELEQTLLELEERVAAIGQPIADTVEQVATIATAPVYAELHPQLAKALDLLVAQLNVYALEHGEMRRRLDALTRWAGQTTRRVSELDALKELG